MKEIEPSQHKNPEIRLLAPLKPYEFDPTKREFIVGKNSELTHIKLSEVEDISEIVRLSGDNFSIETQLDSPEMMFLSRTGALVQMPPLRKWLSSLKEMKKMDIRKKTIETMRSVYKDNMDDKRLKLGRNLGSSIFSFSAKFFDGGTFALIVPGEYSALGVGDPLHSNAIFYWEYFLEDILRNPSLPAEYDLHNADRENGRAKRLSLYAGAGTIAWLAKHGQ